MESTTHDVPETELRFWKPDRLERWPWLEARVTTRGGGTSSGPYSSLNLGLSSGDDAARVHENRDRLRRALGLSAPQLHTLRQVHGTRIHEAPWSGDAEGDGMWTSQPGVVLVIGVADCVPAFVWDERRRCIALLHAGWRGTAAGIVGRALQLFVGQGSRAEDLWLGLGPSIGSCCYPVSEDVAARFPAEALQHDASGRVHVDLRQANRRQALEAGVPAEHVLASPPCTGCNGDTFFSYRKQGARSGRMWALAWMRPEVGA